MSRYLFALWEGGGTMPPALAIIRRLLARGHEVTAIGDPVNAEEIRATGAEALTWTRAPARHDRLPASDPIKDWETKNPLALFKRAANNFLVGPAGRYAADVLEAIARARADVAVVDNLLFGAFMGAEKAGVRTAALMPNINMMPQPGVPPLGPGFLPARGPLGRLRDRIVQGLANRVWARALPPFNAHRQALGLAPLTSFFEQVWRADRVLLMTNRSFDFLPTVQRPNVVYTGPELADPSWAGSWESPWPPGHPDPLVVVGMSSTFQNQAEALRRVVQALAPMKVRALITLGPALDLELPAPAHVVVRQAAPHARVFPEASAVITHCGHGTLMRALAAGVPIVGMPMGRDQNDNAARLVFAGAGARIGPRSSPGRIRAALTRVLEDPAYRAAARRLAAAIAEEVRADRVIAELEQLGSSATMLSPCTSSSGPHPTRPEAIRSSV